MEELAARLFGRWLPVIRRSLIAFGVGLLIGGLAAGFYFKGRLESASISNDTLRETITSKDERIDGLKAALEKAGLEVPSAAFLWSEAQQDAFAVVLAARSEGAMRGYGIVVAGNCRECQQMAAEMRARLQWASGRWLEHDGPISTAIGATIYDGVVIAVPPPRGPESDALRAIKEAILAAGLRVGFASPPDFNWSNRDFALYIGAYPQ